MIGVSGNCLTNIQVIVNGACLSPRHCRRTDAGHRRDGQHDAPLRLVRPACVRADHAQQEMTSVNTSKTEGMYHCRYRGLGESRPSERRLGLCGSEVQCPPPCSRAQRRSRAHAGLPKIAVPHFALCIRGHHSRPLVYGSIGTLRNCLESIASSESESGYPRHRLTKVSARRLSKHWQSRKTSTSRHNTRPILRIATEQRHRTARAEYAHSTASESTMPAEIPAVNGTNGDTKGANGLVDHTPAHPAFDSIPDVIKAFGTLSLHSSFTFASHSNLLTALSTHSKRRIRHRARLALARKRGRPHNRRIRPDPLKSLLYDPLLLRLPLRPAPRLARRRPPPPPNGNRKRGPQPNRLRRLHRCR
jgi:hypothetical protein